MSEAFGHDHCPPRISCKYRASGFVCQVSKIVLQIVFVIVLPLCVCPKHPALLGRCLEETAPRVPFLSSFPSSFSPSLLLLLLPPPVLAFAIRAFLFRQAPRSVS
eukprot:3973-Pyramimonas_sp.AAC.1